MSDLATEMTNSVDKDGQTVMTGALDFNNNGLTDVGASNFTGAITATGGVDGVLGGNTPAAATVTTLTASGTSTLSGAVTIDANVDAQLILARVAGNNRSLQYKTGTSLRWSAYVDGVAESGSTVGSDYQIARYNDAGVFIENALTITRSTGAVAITGAISKGSGSFRIDHPLKPETHQLVHSFTESPQADLLYSGTVDLVSGEAEINLDEYHGMTGGTFVALNRNIRVFTTNESDWEPIKGYVVGNVLHISCQDATCSDSVSWLVIGERHDQHMMDTDWTDDQGRVIVEPEKVIPPEPTYVQRTITVEVEGETEIKTEKVAERVEIIDGVATLIPESTEKVEVPLTKEIPVFNADGSPVMVPA